MEKIEFILRPELQPFVNCIITDSSTNPNGQLKMQLHADGYPGIMFQQSEKGFFLHPRNKKLSELFLYGQTIQPVSLVAEGAYNYIIFQLYPFASKYLLGVDPKILNDDCFDLLQVKTIDQKDFLNQLNNSDHTEDSIAIISDLIEMLIFSNTGKIDDRIEQAVHRIIASRGDVEISQLRDELHITERTFERNFMAETGLTPKQFAKIIRFQYSLQKLNKENIESLTDIGFDSGFADQSHFIREFKKYTGQTPSYYLEQMSRI